jgi:hypothetical protein
MYYSRSLKQADVRYAVAKTIESTAERLFP